MIDNFYGKWQKIKNLTRRLNAVNNILHIFEQQVEGHYFANELKPIKDQLIIDFDVTLKVLIDIFDDNP
jgi:hypothetical protein